MAVDSMTNGVRLAEKEITVPITSNRDIVIARRRGSALAAQLGCSPTNAILIATAISELARNIVLYASRGEIVVTSNGDHGWRSTTLAALPRHNAAWVVPTQKSPTC